MIRRMVLCIAMTGWLVIPMAGCRDDDGAVTPDGAVSVDQGAKVDSGAVMDNGTPIDQGVIVDQAPTHVTFSGTVENAGTQSFIAGATVSVLNASPPNTTTSNAKGEFSLSVKIGSTVFLTVTSGSLLSSMEGFVVTAKPLSNLELIMVEGSFLDTLMTAAGLPKFDKSKGAVLVDFENPAGSGGESATLSASHAGSLALDSTGNPKKSSTLLAGGLSFLIFDNVATGTTTVTGSPAKCLPTYPTITSHPVNANTLLRVELNCK